MWAEKLPSGHYRFTDRFIDPVTGENKRVSVTLDKNTAQTRKLAQEILRTKMYESSPSSMTLSELIRLYNADQEQTVKQSTAFRNQGILDRVLRVLGDVKIDKLTAGYVRKKFTESGKSHTTLNEYLVRYKALMRWAYKYDYINDIRCLDKLDKFPDTPHREKIQDKFLEREELARLLDGMDRWRDVTEFLALTGLRFGEASALLRTDVDLAERTIHVTKTYDPRNGVTTTPKTYQSVRDVYMQDELYALCKRIIASDSVLNMDRLFLTVNGRRAEYDAYRAYLHDKSLEVLGRSITPHTLRHTHASLLMEAGVDIDTISARLGHADSQITKDIYLHITKRLEEQRNGQLKSIKIL
ncbi:MAG: site-specific integrase [Clostridia bacterium]|nr:site-specific integrase [Clostridia bacterium]